MVLAGCLSGAARAAREELRAGNYAEAERLATDGLERDPSDRDLWRVRVRAALEQRAALRAVELYRTYEQQRGDADRELLEDLAFTTLWQSLSVPSPLVKRAAIVEIERLEIERLAESVSRLLGDDDPTVWATAAVAILRAHPDAPALVARALDDSNPRARAIAVEGIGRKLGARARADIEAALDDPDPAVRAAAVGALHRIADAPTDDARLAAVAAADADGAVRARALAALVGDRDDSGDRAEQRVAATTALAAARKALADPYLGARLAAVAIIDRRGGDAETALLGDLGAGQDEFVAARAAVALARRGDANRAFRIVRGLLDSSEWSVRVAALNTLSQLRNQGAAAETAAPLLGDPDLRVALAAARAMLAAERLDEAVGVFRAAAAVEDESIRLQGAVDLVRVGEARGLEVLAALGQSNDPAIRKGAVRAHLRVRDADYRDLPDPALADGLVSGLADPSAEVRVVAAATILDILDRR